MVTGKGRARQQIQRRSYLRDKLVKTYLDQHTKAHIEGTSDMNNQATIKVWPEKKW